MTFNDAILTLKRFLVRFTCFMYVKKWMRCYQRETTLHRFMREKSKFHFVVRSIDEHYVPEDTQQSLCWLLIVWASIEEFSIEWTQVCLMEKNVGRSGICFFSSLIWLLNYFIHNALLVFYDKFSVRKMRYNQCLTIPSSRYFSSSSMTYYSFFFYLKCVKLCVY